MPFNCTLHADIIGSLEYNKWRGCRLLPPKKSRRELFSGFMPSEYFGRGEPLFHQSVVWWFVSYNDLTRFCPWWTIARGNHLDSPKKSEICSDDWLGWRLCSPFRHFGIHFAERFHLSKSSWIMDPTLSPKQLICLLGEIQRSPKICSRFGSIISGVVTVLGHPRRRATQAENDYV